MGARHSKRSVDITTTPKKGGDGAEGDDAKLETVGEPDLKATTNGGLPSDIEFADKDESCKEEEAVEVKENGVPEEAPAIEETPEATAPKGDEPTEPKKKKKKWSFRSISFSRKDKSKPSKEGGSDKNGDVAELAEESADSDKTPSPEGVAPVEGEACALLSNGDGAAPEAPAEPIKAAEPDASPVQQEEPVKVDVAPITVQPVQEEEVAVKEEAPLEVKQSEKKDEQKPAKEEQKPAKEEQQPAKEEVVAKVEVVDTHPEQVEMVEPSIEVPPPLPASNPPSPVTVFAESTKAEAALTSGQLPLEQPKEADIPLPVEQEVEEEEVKPDPSPSMEELPPAPPSPVPEVEPPAEPAKEEEPATPPPTPAPSVEATTSPVLEEPVAPADSLPDISTESLPSLPEAVSESLAPLSLPPVDVVPAPIADTPSPPLAEVTPPVAPLTNGNVNGHSSPSPVTEAAPPLPTKQINADRECEIITEAGDIPLDGTVATSEE